MKSSYFGGWLGSNQVVRARRFAALDINLASARIFE